MWCRFLTFCVLVSFVLFVVASCIYGRPSFHLFFHRCCGDDIENDQVIYENFGHDFLKERLVGGDIVEVDNGTVFESEDIGRIADEMSEVLSINDPQVKKWITDIVGSESHIMDTVLQDTVSVTQFYDVEKEKDNDKKQRDIDESNVKPTSYEMLVETTEDVTKMPETIVFNVHDLKHKRMANVK